jgi:hypothetical protein
MSCNVTGLQSVLGSSLTEPDLLCNVCRAWLQGAFTVPDAPYAQEPASLAHMLMQKSPHLDFLWFGGAILMDLHRYNEVGATCCTPYRSQAVVWTDTFGLPHPEGCFIDPLKGEIARADEARLMFLAQSEYHYPPPPVRRYLLRYLVS